MSYLQALGSKSVLWLFDVCIQTRQTRPVQASKIYKLKIAVSLTCEVVTTCEDLLQIFTLSKFHVDTISNNCCLKFVYFSGLGWHGKPGIFHGAK